MIGSIKLTDSPVIDSAMNSHYSPTSSFTPHSAYSPARTKEPFSDSVLDYIFNEEVDGLMDEIETIRLLPLEF